MAFVPTILKPVHVRAYWRFRLFRWEFVHEHWRSLPNRQEEINLSPESGSNLSDKDFLFLLNSRYLTVFLLKLILKCKRIVRPSISLITYSQSCYPWFIIVFRSGPIQIASMHLPHKARLGVNTISSKNLEGFCSLFFPVTGMRNLHHASGGILCRKQENWDGGIWTHDILINGQPFYQLDYIPRRWTEAQLGEIIMKTKNTKKREE